MYQLISRASRLFFLAVTGLLLFANVAAAQNGLAPNGTITISGFLSCDADNGAKQCPANIHYLQLTEGRTYSLRIASSEFDPSLMIEDLAGALVARDTDNFENLDACVIFMAPKSGNYRMIASAQAPLREGFYMITVQELPSLINIAAELNERDAVRADCYERSYDVPMMQGRKYIIELQSRQFAPYVKILNGEGAIEAFNDESGQNRGTRIVFEARRTGIYRIVATTLRPGETGAFRLNVAEIDE